MARKKTPGLIKRPLRQAGEVVGYIYHIDKVVQGQRLCESTGTGNLAQVEFYLARRIEEIRQAKVFGVRPKRTFDDAAAKYYLDHQHKRSIRHDVQRLKTVMPYIGELTLDQIHQGSLVAYIRDRQAQGISPGTINHGLKIVRRVLNLAASEWFDEYGLTWLATAPKIKLLSDKDKRPPYPLSWDEQERLFKELPVHLANVALFAVNTGCRDQEICQLRWQWEVQVPELNTSVFIIPGRYVKNTDDRLVVLNRIARSVIDQCRGQHAESVFVFQGRPTQRMLNTAWLKARQRAKLPQVRVHDLKHTFGRRLRAAGVSFEDRQDLLGHRSGRITTHYSAPELHRLIEAANSVCDVGRGQPELVVLRRLSVS